MQIKRTIAQSCDNGPCPTTYELDNGEFLFQGYEVTDPEILAGLDIAPGETFIRVPRSLLDEHNRQVNS